MPVTTAKEMFDEVTGRAAEQDIIIKAAAVADYRPKYISDEKVKKKGDNLSLELERTDDILAYLGMHKKKNSSSADFPWRRNICWKIPWEIAEKEPGYDRCEQPEGGRCRIRW